MPSTAPFFELVRSMNATIARFEVPVDALTEITQYLRDDDVRREFFRTLEDPSWVLPLHEAGYFNNPPAPVEISKGAIQHPRWPESQYLARVADRAPEEIASILRHIRTDNSSIIDDIIRATLKMPSHIARDLVPIVVTAADSDALWIYYKDACDLCESLTESKETTAVLQLVDALFTPRFDDKETRRSKRDEYWYKDGLHRIAPKLAQLAPGEMLGRMCLWLFTFVTAEKNPDPESGDDYSYIWRPAIEEHRGNSDYDFVSVFVGITRHAFESALRTGAIPLESALAILNEHNLLVYRRLAVHLINEVADIDPTLVCRTIMDHDLFDDDDFKHEYAMLVGRRFEMLDAAEQAQWYEWIDEGPDMSRFDDFVERADGRAATDKDRQLRKNWWRFEKLHWIRDLLEGDWREFYDKMLAERGEPELADLRVWTGPARFVDESPFPIEELKERSFEDAVDFVCAWAPDQPRHWGPTYSGLASTFRKFVETDPVTFSKLAGVMKDRPAMLVREFIEGLTASLSTNPGIGISTVLELSRWVLEQPVDERTTPKQSGEGLVDRDWRWTRNAIARFVTAVCEARVDGMARFAMNGLRDQLWTILAVLAKDAPESNVVHDVSDDDPRLNDYLNMAINSPRGKAVDAAIEYARWVCAHLKAREGGREYMPGGFNEIPEIRQMLEWQINRGNRSIASSAVIGSKMNLLFWIDRDWIEGNAGVLFNLEGLEQSPVEREGWAAWNAFLVWVHPHPSYFSAFRPQFEYAARQAARVESVHHDHSSERPIYRLAEHLLIVYAMGELSLDSDDDLFRDFLTSVPRETRIHAIGFIGDSLRGIEVLPEGVVDRYMKLWEFYWEKSAKNDLEGDPNARIFGSWLECNQFPSQWIIQQLLAYTEIVPVPHPDHIILQKLDEYSEFELESVLEILRRMIEGDTRGWMLSGNLEPIENILRRAVKAGGLLRQQASELINTIGRRGYVQIGELLL